MKFYFRLKMPTTKFEFEDVDKAKKKYEVLSYVLKYVLGELKTPLSVSFLNTELSSKYRSKINNHFRLHETI